MGSAAGPSQSIESGMVVPNPTPILRFIHVDNLHVLLKRGGLHAPHFTPNDGLVYRMIHNVEIQQQRHIRPVSCGPRGTIHDYVPFYFGYLSPMMLQLKTGQVQGYTEGQEPLIYLVSTAQAIQQNGIRYVFTNGHGIAALTDYFDDLAQLNEVDWRAVSLRYWRSTVDDMDQQRRKQAEFLVHRFCPWSLIQEVAVIDGTMRAKVEHVMAGFPEGLKRLVTVRRDWYY
jgi:hypothetical protein